MSDDLARFAGGIPENYDRGLGPHLFDVYGARLAQEVATARPSRVLETAAGTGIVTRLLRDALAPSAHLTATDLSPPMLDLARQKFQKSEAVTFETADATELPFEGGAFDAVACQFGVMFFPDKDLSYREVFRTLAPGGRYFFNVWDEIARNPFARIMQETSERLFPEDPPKFYELPFGYYEVEPIRTSLAAAGFDEIECDVRKIEKEIPSIYAFAKGLVLGNPLSDEVETRGTISADEVLSAVCEALSAEFGDNPGRMPLQAIAISARRA